MARTLGFACGNASLISPELKMRTSKIMSCGIALIVAVYAAIFIHAINAFSTRAYGSTSASSGMTAQPELRGSFYSR
jgi:hypothetical protein